MSDDTREFGPLPSALLWRRLLLMPAFMWPLAIFGLYGDFHDWSEVALAGIGAAVAGGAFGLIVDDSRGGTALPSGMRPLIYVIGPGLAALVAAVSPLGSLGGVGGALCAFAGAIWILTSSRELWRRRREGIAT